MRLLNTLALAAFVLAVPARAEDGGASAAFAAETVAARDAAYAELEATADDPATAYALGALDFFMALEGLGQALHRHGFDSPRTFLLPLFRLPVPDNPDPEPLDYEGMRAILENFDDGLSAAAERLAAVIDGAAIAIDVDLMALRLDLDGDGVLAPQESIAAIMATIAAPGGAQPADPAAAPALSFRFDLADGYWLRGYANFLMAQTDFWLAHDFRATFDNSFHMLFPRAGLPMQDALVPSDDGQSGGLLSSEWRIADLISLIHLIDWPVIEPDRRADVRRHLLAMIDLSRETFAAIAAETDNEREWLPGPKQPGIHPLTGLEVGVEQVSAWMEALSLAEDVLEGRALIPHFRFADKGIDMKRFFDEPHVFDLVLMVTGPGAVPYLAEGRILTGEEFEAIRRRFGDQGMTAFALWFN